MTGADFLLSGTSVTSDSQSVGLNTLQLLLIVSFTA